MSLKRNALESLVFAAALFHPSRRSVSRPKSIFVLRNNDIGDLLVVTPLFEALKRTFPDCRIAAGVGTWNVDVLKENPFVDDCVPINAPWHNKHVCRHPHNSLRGLSSSLQYMLKSPEIEALARYRFDVGIDVLGSPQGSLLMMRAGIPYRIGVKGYAGGHSGTQHALPFEPKVHVGRSALRSAEVLGATNLPESRPQIFLTREEENAAEQHWNPLDPMMGNRIRIVIGPGGGFREKCWPLGHYEELVRLLHKTGEYQISVVGGAGDRDAGERFQQIAPEIQNFTGRFNLRETFALVARADLVICNSSMLMHVAAAFAKPAVVLLGDWYDSAHEHAEQWGHGALSLVKGPEPGKPQICTPVEALSAVRSIVPNRERA